MSKRLYKLINLVLIFKNSKFTPLKPISTRIRHQLGIRILKMSSRYSFHLFFLSFHFLLGGEVGTHGVPTTGLEGRIVRNGTEKNQKLRGCKTTENRGFIIDLGRKNHFWWTEN